MQSVGLRAGIVLVKSLPSSFPSYYITIILSLSSFLQTTSFFLFLCIFIFILFSSGSKSSVVVQSRSDDVRKIKISAVIVGGLVFAWIANNCIHFGKYYCVLGLGFFLDLVDREVSCSLEPI